MFKNQRTLRFMVLITACLAFTAAAATAQTETKSIFRNTQVAENVINITERGSVNMFLVLGQKQALLIDTGMGGEDLGAYVKGLTQLPVIVVNTHGHMDHAGGNRYFDKFFAHPDDLQAAKGLSRGKGDFTPVKEGYVFDLGGRKLTVIDAPGHTAGSICLLDAANKMIFTGDNNNSETWLFLGDSLPLETYQRTLGKLIARAGEFEKMYPGHGGSLPPSYLNHMADCAAKIQAGEIQGKPDRNHANALYVTYQGAMIVYNPNKLKDKK